MEDSGTIYVDLPNSNEHTADPGCLIDIHDLSPGNLVFEMKKGYVKVKSVSKSEKYPIIIEVGDSFTKDGKHVHTDKYPTLFKSNPFEYLYNKINILNVEKSQLKQENDNLWERMRAQGLGV